MGYSGWQVSQTCGSVPGMHCDGREGCEVGRGDGLYEEASGCVPADNRVYGSLFILAQKEGKKLELFLYATFFFKSYLESLLIRP